MTDTGHDNRADVEVGFAVKDALPRHLSTEKQTVKYVENPQED
jgi:hypothetical protein